VATVLTLGAKKHGDKGSRPNWVDGLSFASHYGAAQRHMNAYWQGETHDEEGFHHLAAAAANILILMDLDLRHNGTPFDDRPEPIPESCPIPPSG
jgi:hypothetical protein